PEYFLGESGTNRSDIFSLGIITYQMLSGQLPYGNAVSKVRNQTALRRLSYTPLRNSDNNIQEWLDLAISKAIHPEPSKRYQEVSEFIHELKRPSQQFLNQKKPPLMQRNPVLFWQSTSAVLFFLLLWVLAK
ncbi:MAG TPA: protein kinase, partial [Methylococcaceae bacterium]|nr:protein kinase [Methylococcaceae bacterium]